MKEVHPLDPAARLLRVCASNEDDDPEALLPIELQNVSKTFGPVRALVGVSWRFEEGINVVVGANGSGKSTLLAIVGALVRPSSGALDHGALGPRRMDVAGIARLGRARVPLATPI